MTDSDPSDVPDPEGLSIPSSVDSKQYESESMHNRKGYVPIEELEALVEDWRAKAFENGSDLYAEGISESAQELQEIITEYGENDE